MTAEEETVVEEKQTEEVTAPVPEAAVKRQDEHVPQITRFKRKVPHRESPGPGPVEGGYAIAVVLNDTIQPVENVEGSSVVKLQSKSQYKLKITNANCHEVEMQLVLDGLDAGTYVISEHTSCEVQRTLKHLGPLCLTPSVDGSKGRTIQISCLFSAPCDAPTRQFVIYKGWDKLMKKTVTVFPTHSIKDLLRKAKASWNTYGSDFLLFCGGADWMARALEEHSLPLNATVWNLPTELYFLEHRKLQFTFSHIDGRLVKSIGFRREMTVSMCIRTLSEQWRLQKEDIVLCTSRGTFTEKSFPSEEHVLALFTMAELLENRGMLQVCVRTSPPSGTSQVTVYSEHSGIRYQLLLQLNSYTAADLCGFIYQQEGLDVDQLCVHSCDDACVGNAECMKSLAQLRVAAGDTIKVTYDDVAILQVDKDADTSRALRAKCAESDRGFSEEAYRVVDLGSSSSQSFVPILGFETDSKMIVKLRLTLVET